jgi:P27 family predicted phage terminase small subunit
MGLRGPAPKPTALRRIEGNPARRPLPKNEPQYDRGLPEKPKRMSAGARRVWDELVNEMAGAAVLRRVDRRALWQLAEDEALIAEAYEGLWKMVGALKKKAADEGKTLPAGALMSLLTMSNGKSAMRAIRDLSMRLILERREFGLTPSSRSRIETAVEAGAIDSLELKLCG